MPNFKKKVSKIKFTISLQKQETVGQALQSSTGQGLLRLALANNPYGRQKSAKNCRRILHLGIEFHRNVRTERWSERSD